MIIGEVIQMRKDPFYKSVLYALEGVFASLKQERNMKIHFVMMILVIIFGFLMKISYYEWLICIFLIGWVISLEIINTAVEAIVDLCSPDYHPLAKLAKDAAAGAVLVSAVASSIIGLIIFIPKMMTFLI